MRNIIFILTIAILMLACATPAKKNNEIVKLEVNGELWRSVADFTNSTPDDKHYVVRVEDETTTVIHFGDGKHGARPPTNTNEIRVRYRTESDTHYTSVYKQQGRVRLDGDENCK